MLTQSSYLFPKQPDLESTEDLKRYIRDLETLLRQFMTHTYDDLRNGHSIFQEFAANSVTNVLLEEEELACGDDGAGNKKLYINIDGTVYGVTVT